MLTRRNAILATLAFGAFATHRTAFAGAPMRAVSTFSILGDLVRNVGGARIAGKNLVGPNGDAHVYEPTPTDAKTISEAAIVFANGLGFEGWMTRLVKASGTKAEMVVATKGIAPRRMTAEDSRGHGRAITDPHAWQSVPNAKVYVANIRDALARVDPDGKAAYEAAASAYLGQLDVLDKEVREAIAKIPADRRKIITTHDSFGYFHATYGIDFIAPEGVSTESEASARDVARIITQIKREKIPAVFLENVTDPRLIKRIAAETGAKIGGTLYSDALTNDNGPAPSYLAMMRHNVKTLGAALMI